MKKILYVVAILIAMTSCETRKDVEFKSLVEKGYTPYIYVLDTLDNGHILMRDKSSRDYGLIEYPECPKCKENLKKTIIEVLDSMKDESIIKMLANETD